jgi:zinc finger SWIM domain-containing protein 3
LSLLVFIFTSTRFPSGAALEVIADEINVLSGTFYQDPQMRQLFANYPELLLLDATYKLNDLRLPLYVMLAVDRNSKSVIVALWIVTTEGRETLASMIQFFKQHNPKWIQTSVIMTAKDMTERDVLHAEFPSASLLLCLFHMLRSFGREITTGKMNISSSERMMILDLLQKIACIRSEQQYNLFYQDLQDTRLPKVVEYYNKNLHVCRHEWVPGRQQRTNYLQRTNNRVECINQKLKQVINHRSSMDEFVADLLRTVNALRDERIHRAAYIFQKQPVVKTNNDAALASLAQLLTCTVRFFVCVCSG